MSFTNGEKIWWRRVTNRGYGYAESIPAIFLATGARRDRILVHSAKGAPKELSVNRENLTRRDSEYPIDRL